jgi:putative endonuclease
MVMGKRRVQLGRQGEGIVEAALRKRQYTIVERNWRCPVGEVDLIARKDRDYFFVEVRTRRSAQPVSPEQGLTYRKRERMEKVARYYLGQSVEEDEAGWHLSFAAVILGQEGIKRMTFYPDMDAEPVDLI